MSAQLLKMVANMAGMSEDDIKNTFEALARFTTTILPTMERIEKRLELIQMIQLAKSDSEVEQYLHFMQTEQLAPQVPDLVAVPNEQMLEWFNQPVAMEGHADDGSDDYSGADSDARTERRLAFYGS